MTSSLIWNGFLHHVSGDKRDQLVGALSDERLRELLALPVIPLEKLEQIRPWQEDLSRVHYSWFSPFLRTLPEREIKLFLSAMTPQQARGLKDSLLLSNTLPAISPVGKDYLQQVLHQTLQLQDVLPIALLPPDPLNDLLDWQAKDLFYLIDMLSMHDLSVEIKQVIDNERLKEIYSLLTKSQRAFLNRLLHQKEPIAFKRLGLANWDRDHEVLHALLVQRGVNRLAKALYPRHPSLRWYIAHQLDLETGEMLLKLATPLSHEAAYELLAGQIMALKDQILGEL